MTILQQLINALSLGGTYALLALSVALVFNIMNLVNFAHADVMTLSGFTLFFGLQVMPFLPAAVLALVVGALAAMLLERLAFRPLRGASGETLMLASLAVSILLQVTFQNAISTRAQAVPQLKWLEGTITLGSLRLGVVQILSIVVTLMMMAAISLMLRHTTIGLAMRAAAFDFSTTRLMGVQANRVFTVAFALSGMLAGVAAVLWVGQRGTVDPVLGFNPVLQAFIAAVVGGLGTLAGPVLGGLLLGFVTVMVEAYVPDALQQFQPAIVIALVVLVIAVRPAGLIAPSDAPTILDRFRAWRQPSESRIENATITV